MTASKLVSRSIMVVVIVAVLALGAGQALGQPVGLSYVETDSMAPTMEPGDGFIAVPKQLDGSVDRNDVIVFDAEELNGGDLTTHRVVGETERGYITKGDGNPVADQDGTEPPVKRAQIVATALQVDGQVVVIPQLGTAVEMIQLVFQTGQQSLASALGTRSVLGTQGLAYLFFAATLLWYGVGVWQNRAEKSRGRETSRADGMDSRLVVGLFAALLVAGATAAMVAPAGTQDYSIVSADFNSDRPTVIPQGESNDVTYPVDNGGLLPIVSYLEPASEGVAVSPRESHVGPRSMANATVTLQAPPETGTYRRFVVEHRYLAILPLPVIQTLYAIHPWAPIAVIDAMIGIPFYLLGVRLVGTGRIRDRNADRGYGYLTRVRRLVSRLY